jgi:hypothetical protein
MRDQIALTAIVLTREVFPAFCKPTRESSISCLKNKLGKEQSKSYNVKYSQEKKLVIVVTT